MGTKTIDHVFVSERDQGLPRWVEAFDEVLVLSCELLSGDYPGSIFWLDIPAGTNVRDGLERLLMKIGKNRRVIVLSAIPNDEDALAAFSLGAKGFCNAHSSPGNLRQVASVVSQGGLWLGESLLTRLIQATANTGILSNPPFRSVGVVELPDLTPREHQVAEAVASGASNKEIARRLSITERTVKAHVGSVFDKLGVRDRLQLSILFNRGR